MCSRTAARCSGAPALGSSWRQLPQGILCDGLTSALAAVFHVSPMVTYSANIGLLKLTGVKSRFIVGFAGAMIAALGFVLCGGS